MVENVTPCTVKIVQLFEEDPAFSRHFRWFPVSECNVSKLFLIQAALALAKDEADVRKSIVTSLKMIGALPAK